jgi:hypothetical protein
MSAYANQVAASAATTTTTEGPIVMLRCTCCNEEYGGAVWPLPAPGICASCAQALDGQAPGHESRPLPMGESAP